MLGDAGFIGDGVRGIAALAVVLGLALLLAWGARRSGLIRAQGGTQRLAVVASLNLDGRNRLVLVRFEAREHLLAVGPAGVTVVESRDASPPAPGDAR
jgi:flagellar biogenesis protein FliO